MENKFKEFARNIEEGIKDSERVSVPKNALLKVLDYLEHDEEKDYDREYDGIPELADDMKEHIYKYIKILRGYSNGE
jgi:hypothetical protein